MRKGIRHNPTGCLLLQSVITDCRGRIKRFLDVPGFQKIAGPIRVIGPNSGETVCLQLLADG